MSLVVLTLTTLSYVLLFPGRRTWRLNNDLKPGVRNTQKGRRSEENKGTMILAVPGYVSTFDLTSRSKAPFFRNHTMINKNKPNGPLGEFVKQKRVQRFRSPVLLKGQVWEPQPNMPDINRDIGVKITPTTCDLDDNPVDQKGIFLLILILSAVKNYKERMAIRQTYGSINSFHHREIRQLFLLAQIDDDTEMRRVSDESESFSDIIQFDFKDTYRNLTLKTVAGLTWVSENCKTRYVLKTDDDVMVFTERIVGFLEGLSKKEEENLYSGCTHHGVGIVIRNPRSKFYVSESVYPYRNYPPYNFGLGILMSRRVVGRFARAWKKVPFIPAEDVFIGLLAKSTRIVPTCNKAITCSGSTNNKYFLKQIPTFCSFANVMLIPLNVGPVIMKQSWEHYAKNVKRETQCWTQNYFFENICDWYPKELVLPKS
ncbi:beta-1,3-galactosyltransferase 1-like [Lineus longissimus]|uniref:beta-1,3-galactosyltransferase 1-like n=1 Tax=Lineus longissimus TaxID=88925 RepID=UPI00315DABA5